MYICVVKLIKRFVFVERVEDSIFNDEDDGFHEEKITYLDVTVDEKYTDTDLKALKASKVLMFKTIDTVNGCDRFDKLEYPLTLAYPDNTVFRSNRFDNPDYPKCKVEYYIIRKEVEVE